MSAENNYKPMYKKGDLLTKMECCNLFCEELRIAKSTYFKHYRPYIRFKSYAGRPGVLMRIPFEVALGLINQVRETPQDADPPDSVLEGFMKKEMA